ncbi:gliding motility-associated protein GldE [Compostibacter hankyongensis]|uniref:Gliding motility-associated protein GldE n=1 Tax=Compostibacter hankyongensis TaxID=1007089 RepID=A0ABP8FDS5_9BACT
MDYYSAIFLTTALPLQVTHTAGPNVTVFAILSLLLLILAALLSGAEVAFFSLTLKDLNMLKTRENNNARLVTSLLEKPKMLQSTLLITTTFSNIAAIFMLNFLLDQLVGLDQNLVLSLTLKIVMITLVLLLFSVLLPKVYAAQNNIRMALTAAPVVSGLNSLFEPLSNLITFISDAIEKKLSRRHFFNVSEEEMDQAIELSVDESTSQEEKNILLGIIKFGNITVKQIMRTRLDVSGIDYDMPLEEVIRKVGELHYSRLPVYKGNLDNIAGVVHTKDLLPYLENRQDFDWHSIVRQPYFIHEHKLIEDLLKEFQRLRIHLAIVVDEFGGTSGIVTLEDIMEEIIGDIRDEFDEDEFSFSKTDENNYIFEGKTMLNDVCRIMNLPANTFASVKGESDSLGGLILELAGQFPEINSVISHDRFDFTILEINKMRIQKVKVTIQPE